MQISQTQDNSRFNCSKLWKKAALYSVVCYFLLTNSLGFTKDFKLESSRSSSDPANGCCRQKDLPNGSNLSTFKELVIMREYSWKKIKFFSSCLGDFKFHEFYFRRHVDPSLVTSLMYMFRFASQVYQYLPRAQERQFTTARGTSIQIWSKLEQNPDYCALPHVVIWRSRLGMHSLALHFFAILSSWVF